MSFPSPVTSQRMGRPPLNVRETKVRLPEGMRERIIALVGNHRMAAFIRDAVEAALNQAEASRKSSSNPDGPFAKSGDRQSGT